MQTYSELKPLEKLLYDKIERIFLDHKAIPRDTFAKILYMLAVKYKK